MTAHPRSDDPGRDGLSPADAALAAALARAGEQLAGDPPAEVATTQLAAIRDLAVTHAHTAPTAARGTTLRTRLRRVFGLTVVKVALGAGVAAAATGGLAAGGNLPDPVQQVVSDGARWFGVDLPATEPARPAPADPAPGEGAADEVDQVDDVPAPHPAPPVSPSAVVDPPTEDDRPPGTAEPAGRRADPRADPPADLPDHASDETHGEGDGPPDELPVPDEPEQPDDAGTDAERPGRP